MSANFGGINAQSDVFKFAVKIGEKEYDIKALRQDTAVTKKLLQSFTDRYGDERGIKIHAPVGSSSQTPAETNTGNNQAGDPLQVQLT